MTDWTFDGSQRQSIHVHAVIDSLRWGGAETLLADFASGAAGAGIRLSVSSLDSRGGSPAAERLREHGVEPVDLGVQGLVTPAGVRTVRRHIAALRPDLVHTHLNYADASGGIAARSLGLPAVSTIHVMAWERTPRELAKETVSSLVRRTAMQRVICVSDVAREAFLRARWDRPARVVSIHNGVCGTARPGAGAAVRAELGLAEDDLVVTMLTVLRPAKGHEVAVEAVAALRAAHPRLRLVVAGEGPAREEIGRAVADLGDGGLMIGHRNDVMELLDATNVLLHPTEVDAFPTALLQAGAASVPVVATAVGGIPEIIEDDVTGLLVEAPPAPGPVAGALGRVLGDAELRARLGAAARARFDEHFRVDHWVERTRALYDEVLASRSS